MKMAPIRLMALLYAAHALQPLTILPVGRPLLPLDTISYGIETKMFEELTAQHECLEKKKARFSGPFRDALHDGGVKAVSDV